MQPFRGIHQMRESDFHDARRYPNFDQNAQFAFLANRSSSVCYTKGLRNRILVLIEPESTKILMNSQHSQVHISNVCKAIPFIIRFSLLCHLELKFHYESVHMNLIKSTFSHPIFNQVPHLESFLTQVAIIYLLNLKCHVSDQT